MARITPWARPHYRPGGEPARVALHCLSENPLPRAFVRSASDGFPDAWPAELDLSTVRRDRDPELFERILRGPLGEAARAALAPSGLALEDVRYAHSVVGTIPDPPDLAYLQAAWAVARILLKAGARAVLDEPTLEWRPAVEVLAWPPDRAFSLARELVIVFEVQPNALGQHVVHTRGLAKFGRPDLIIAGIDPADLGRAEQFLRSLAEGLALGRLVSSGEPLVVEGFPPTRLVTYRPGAAMPDLALDNPGLVLSALPGAARPEA